MTRRLTALAGVCALVILAACASAGGPSVPAPAVPAAVRPAPPADPAAGAAAGATARPAARNVILFISDGASAGTWDMTSYWEHGALGRQPYDRWPVKLGMTTYPLNTSRTPSSGTAPVIGYDPARAWDTAASPPGAGDRPARFAGYGYIMSDYTDSAAAGTALATGQKTYNSGISVDDFGRPLAPVTDAVRAAGKATGVVTSVPFSHATPAVFGASNLSRNNYAAIARDMIAGDRLDVIFGTGHPLFDDDGLPRAADFDFIGAPEWEALRAGTTRRVLLEDTARFAALARGEALPDGPVIGLPRVGSTLQFARTPAVRGADPRTPSGVAFNPGLPDLATLTLGALNIVARDPDGFFLMVEGGAVDWAAHANDTGRVIEEQAGFNAAISATMGWLEQRGLAADTLVIVLTDHGNGMPYGPQSQTLPFQPVENRGRGVLPGVRWHFGSHTNENTRLWATGPGAGLLEARVRLRDPQFAARTGHNADGATIDNTDIQPVIREALGLR